VGIESDKQPLRMRPVAMSARPVVRKQCFADQAERSTQHHCPWSDRWARQGSNLRPLGCKRSRRRRRRPLPATTVRREHLRMPSASPLAASSCHTACHGLGTMANGPRTVGGARHTSLGSTLDEEDATWTTPTTSIWLAAPICSGLQLRQLRRLDRGGQFVDAAGEDGTPYWRERDVLRWAAEQGPPLATRARLSDWPDAPAPSDFAAVTLSTTRRTTRASLAQ